MSLRRPTITRPVSYSIFGNTEERRIFDFFSRHSVAEFAGAFQSDFWTKLILRSAHSQPAIRHSVLALGAQHERILKRLPPDESNDFAVQQYSKVVEEITSATNGQSDITPDVALIACVLMTCFESLRGNTDRVIFHTYSGLGILNDIAKQRLEDPSSSSEDSAHVPIDMLIGIFSRLELQTSTLLDPSSFNEAVIMKRFIEQVAPATPKPIPSIFTTVSEAKDHLLATINMFLYQVRVWGRGHGLNLIQWPQEILDEVLVAKSHYLSQFEAWGAAYEACIATDSATLDNRALKTLFALMISCNVLVRHFPNTDEVDYDNYEVDFERLIATADDALTNASSSTPELYVFDLGLIELLLWVTAKCRDPVIRRSLALFARVPMQEGILHRSFAAKVCARIIKLEEELLDVRVAGDVPAERRVKEFSAVFLPERRAIVRYYLGETVVEEEVAW